MKQVSGMNILQSTHSMLAYDHVDAGVNGKYQQEGHVGIEWRQSLAWQTLFAVLGARPPKMWKTKTHVTIQTTGTKLPDHAPGYLHTNRETHTRMDTHTCNEASTSLNAG